jgi:archaeosine synthase alpha-subunit
MVSMQFGYDLRVPGLEVKGSYPEMVVKKGRQQVFSVEPHTGMLRPTFEGWALIETGYRVYIDDFVPQGDILAPGVVEADPAIREGDEVLIIGEKAMATGRAAMSADEMIRSHRGVAVRVRKVKKLDG